MNSTPIGGTKHKQHNFTHLRSWHYEKVISTHSKSYDQLVTQAHAKSMWRRLTDHFKSQRRDRPMFLCISKLLKAKFDGTPQPFFSVTNVSGVSFWHFSGLSSWGRFRVEKTRVLGIYKWDLAALQVAFIERWNLPQSNLGVNRRSWLPPPHDSRRWRAH
jgi:hypothetical protein